MLARSLVLPCSLVLATGVLQLTSCRSQPTASDPQPEPAHPRIEPTATASLADEQLPSAPVDAQGRYETVWEYLVEKYDADGDGRVALAEYDRGETAFSRLDRDADGFVDARDFERGEDGVAMMMAQLVMGLYLQDDDDPDTLPAEELEQAFGAYDADFDALLTRPEFEARSAERKALGRELDGAVARQVEGEDPYEVLAGAIDENGDGVLDYEELMAFHGRFLSDGELPRMYAARRRSTRSARPEPAARVGEPAPDFTLEPYHGDAPVRLSSYRGQKPVALIFGSYT